MTRCEPLAATPAGAASVDRDRAALLAREWWLRIAVFAGPVLTPGRAQQLLTELVCVLATSLCSEPPTSTEAARRAGRALVGAGLIDPIVLARSTEILAQLPAFVDPDAPHRFQSAIVLLTGALGQGFTEARQSWTPVEPPTPGPPTDFSGSADETQFRKVFDRLGVAVAVSNADATVVTANRAWEQLLGRPVEQLTGKSVGCFLRQEDRNDLEQEIRRPTQINVSGPVRLETRFPRRDGSIGWVAFAITRGVGAGQDPSAVVVAEDITDRRRLHAELTRQARYDALTSLPNRLHLIETLRRRIAETAPAQRIGLCYLDLDGFKTVNDRHGHGVGDRLLVAVAARLNTRAAVHGDFVARLGGDEFVVVVGDQRVASAAQSFSSALAHPFLIDGHRLSISASIGAIVVPRLGCDGRDVNAEQLIDAADVWLYKAKHNHDGRVVLHERCCAVEHG